MIEFEGAAVFADEEADFQLVSSDENKAELLFSNINNIDTADLLNEALEVLKRSRFRADPEAEPWVPGAQDGWYNTFEDSTLAPSPGPAYNEYYSATGKHAQIHERKIRKKNREISARRRLKSNGLRSFRDGMSFESDPETSAYSQCAVVATASRRRGCHDSNVECIREGSEGSQICRAVDCVSFSAETLASIFFPGTTSLTP